MSLQEDSHSSPRPEGTCCCFSIMSWVGKVKELAGGKPTDGAVGHGRKSNSKIGKENGTHRLRQSCVSMHITMLCTKSTFGVVACVLCYACEWMTYTFGTDQYTPHSYHFSYQSYKVGSCRLKLPHVPVVKLVSIS